MGIPDYVEGDMDMYSLINERERARAGPAAAGLGMVSVVELVVNGPAIAGFVSARSRSLISPVKPVVQVQQKIGWVQLEQECPSRKSRLVLNFRFFFDPIGYFLVASTGGNKAFESLGVDLSESEEGLVERAIEMIGPGGGG
jgi:hypothetical protein